MTTLRRKFIRVLGPLLLASLALLVLPAHAQAPARTEAGRITLVTGSVVVNAPDGSRRTPRVNDTLFEGDKVITGSDGELQAEMVDSGVIAVRNNTQMGITKYRAQGDAEDTSVFSLIKGSFRSITGWIGKNNPARYQIATPTATIGVRGTDHEPLVIPEGSTQGEPGTYDKVSAGGSFIQNQGGQRVEVTQGRSGFFGRGAQAPRLLDRVPTFYRPSRNEGRLEGLHDRLRPQLDQRRTERAQFVRTGVRPAGVGADRPGFGPRSGGGQQNGAGQRGQNLREQRQEQRQQNGNGRPGEARQGLPNRQNENRPGAQQNRAGENRQQQFQQNRQQLQESRQQNIQARQQQFQQNHNGETPRQAVQQHTQAQQHQQVQQQRPQAQQRPVHQNEREEKKRH